MTVNGSNSNVTNNSVFLMPRDIPKLPDSLPLKEWHKFIPNQFSNILEVDISGDVLTLIIKNPENEFNRSIAVHKSLYEADNDGFKMPKFIFQESSVRPRVEYFGADKSLVLNKLQVLYLVLQNRLAMFMNYNKAYVGLLMSDIENLYSFVEFSTANTRNSYLKTKNTYAVINYLPHAADSKPLGAYINSSRLNEAEWQAVFRDLPIDISSETSMSKSNKIVLLPHDEEYKAVGYKRIVNPANGEHAFLSVFPPKQNLPARTKTHILGNGYKLNKPDTSVFIQNLKHVFDSEKGEWCVENVDQTKRKVLVVFDSMDSETKRFVAGEIESTKTIAETLVHVVQSINLPRISKTQTLDIGSYHQPMFSPFVLGIDEYDNEVSLYNVKEFTIVDRYLNGVNGLITLKLDMVIKAGNARIISDTGLKGVTKTKPNLGYISIKDSKPTVSKPEFTPSTREYLKSVGQWEEATSTSISTKELILPVEMIAGMNAVKAGSNTIALAQAAFAVEYGYYTPRLKQGMPNLLNSLDADEINAAAASVPEHTFIDEFGNSRKVFFGIAYVIFTELGSVFTTFKKQPFAFEAGKTVLYNDPNLYSYIWDNCLDTKSIDLVKELTKVYYDDRAYLNNAAKATEFESINEQPLPMYSALSIRKNKTFTSEDLILTKKSAFLTSSKLLDEKWNKVGFYIDLSKYKAPIIRIPSAKVLNNLVGVLKDGEYIYHEIIVNISKIISNIISHPTQPLIGYIFDKKGLKHTSYSLYMSSVKGTLYSDDKASQMKVQSLLKPMIDGVNLKQVVEHRLPLNTIVIFNKFIYRRMCNVASDGDINMTLDFDNDANTTLLSVLNKDCPLSISVHSPFLWSNQFNITRIWDEATYALWLKMEYGINLHDYLDTKTNNDIALIHPLVALGSKKDKRCSFLIFTFVSLIENLKSYNMSAC